MDLHQFDGRSPNVTMQELQPSDRPPELPDPGTVISQVHTDADGYPADLNPGAGFQECFLFSVESRIAAVDVGRVEVGSPLLLIN